VNSRLSIACCIGLLFASAVHAVEPVPPATVAAATAATAATTAPVDVEEQLDEGLKSFGYLTGLARGCVVPEQRPKLEREALDLGSAIARLFGTDRAFLYSSAFGYGTSVAVETKDCAEVLRQYDQRVAKFRANRGGAQ
jgi:hypothetical protein